MKREQPPYSALRFLRWFCKPSYVESIEGDLIELFECRVQKSAKRAKKLFWMDTLAFFKLRYIRSFDDIPLLNPFQMIRNYLKIGLRSLWKYRYYTGINIIGLSLGLSCCLLIFLFVKHEISYDKFYADSERIYRVTLEKGGGYTPARLVSYMKNDYPDIESGTRIMGMYPTLFKIDDQLIKEPKGAIADSTFFDVFSTKFIKGNKQTALSSPNSLVLTQSLAKKYFPNSSAFGEIIEVDGELRKVTAVVADPPKNTHFPFTYLMDIPRQSWATEGYWTGNNFYSYLKLKSNRNPAFLEAKFPEFVEKYLGPEIVKFSEYNSYDEFLSAGKSYGFRLFPLEDIHLKKSNLNFENPGNENNVITFTFIAFLILIIACINYINMSTSHGALRAKEVGLRKVMGSTRSGLIVQFLVESVLITLTSIILAIALTFLLLPFFGELMGRSFDAHDVLQPFTIVVLGILLCVVGLLAGGYPAYFLSSFSPVNALKGSISGKGNTILRKGMVIFQFAISLFLITVTLMIYRQVQFMTTQELGVEKEHVYIVKDVNDLGDKVKTFVDRLKQNPNIKSVATSNQMLFNSVADWRYSTVEKVPKAFSPRNIFVSKDFLDVLGLELLSGRFFDGRQSDSTSLIINQSLAKQLRWDNPIGHQLSRGENENYTIVGVVRDFNFGSLKHTISPLLFRNIDFDNDGFASPNYALVKSDGDQLANINYIEEQWNIMAEGVPIEASFLDTYFDNLFDEERRFGKIFGSFSFLGICIALMGLFALVAFTMEKRYKELAIRKAMGASVFNLLGLVVKDFTRLVILGSLIAIPLAFYCLDAWLSDYAYRISLHWYWLAVPVIFLTILTWIVVIFQSYGTTRQNPAMALKAE